MTSASISAITTPKRAGHAHAVTDTGMSPLAGLGYRRAMSRELLELPAGYIDFLEVAPENWIGLGGRLARRFRELSERYPVYLHGLSLNIGGRDSLDLELVRAIRDFIAEHRCPVYSEHLSYCGDRGHLYDLMPMPFTQDAARHVAERVQQVQDILGQRMLLENVSYYCSPGQEMSEAEFITEVCRQADCDLLLDVNNVYVNSINHNYDPRRFMASLPEERVRYYHVAGHYDQAEDLKVDTHGSDVIAPVWSLLEEACRRFGLHPTLLERDFNIPPLAQLLTEVEQIRRCQQGVSVQGGSAGLGAGSGV